MVKIKYPSPTNPVPIKEQMETEKTACATKNKNYYYFTRTYQRFTYYKRECKGGEFTTEYNKSKVDDLCQSNGKHFIMKQNE